MNGTTAYLEAPHAAELASPNWTIELWFKDEHTTYNHARTRIFTKGDIASSEVPYFASISSNMLTVGARAGGSASTVTFNLATAGISANAWHHLAITYVGSSRLLTIYIDGVQRTQGILTLSSSGNTLPVILGRSGSAGENFLGKLDDVRIWNVVRTSTEIAGNFHGELGGAPAGLVSNWRFDDESGVTAIDSAGVPENAALFGGAVFSAESP